MGKFIDLTGQRFGRLVVIKRSPENANNHPLWECICDCGNTTLVRANSLRPLRTQSCGCLHTESAKTVLRRGNFKHGKSKSQIYRVWDNMLNRCSNPRCPTYQDYGGRGITVCERWYSFENFHADMGERPGDDYSIDRIDVDGNYELNNCRWATWTEQANNKRNTKEILVKGEMVTLPQAAQRAGMSLRTLQGRLKKGWTAEEAISLSANNGRRRENYQSIMGKSYLDD